MKYIQIDTQTGRLKYIQTEIHTDRQPDRHHDRTYTQTGRMKYIQTDTQTD